MDTDAGCCGGESFSTLAPAAQAQLLARLARQARLLQFSLEDTEPSTDAVADRLQRALEQALDADAGEEAEAAQRALDLALGEARDAGLRLSAEVGEVEVEGVAGVMRMGVLTAVLARAPLAAPAVRA